MVLPDVILFVLFVHIPFYGFPISYHFSLEPRNKTWLLNLKLRSSAPSGVCLYVVWIILYSTMGIASFLVWKANGGVAAWTLYGIQLAIQLAWAPIFYGTKDLKLATYWNLMLLIFVLPCGIMFGLSDPIAGLLLLPYVAWLAYFSLIARRLWKAN